MRNCSRYYKPSSQCTVDEQLLSFRGRCIFRMYMKAKPDKYGLKIVTLNDAQTFYLVFGIPYLGKSMISHQNELIPEYFFREITTPIHGTNRTVTCDNWFTSIPLIQRMLEPTYNLTITGTIRKNKREIPAEMKVACKEPPSTKFCFTPDMTLVSHTPKKNKIVLLVSSYMHTDAVRNSKPNIILHYNDTKGGTDCFDKLCHSYSVSRPTSRWPLRIFFGMLDQAAVNARILCNLKHLNNEGHTPLTAKESLKRIIRHLVTPHLQERYSMSSIRINIKKNIADFLGIDVKSTTNNNHERLTLPLRCGLCNNRQSDKKTRQVCQSCRRPMCDTHRMYVCVECGIED